MNRISVTLVLLACSMVGCRRSPAYYLERGNKFFANQRYDDAILNYRKALQADARFGEAYYQLGLAELRLDRATEAYLALSQAEQLLPGRDDVKAALGHFCVLTYLADARRPKVLYEQAARISDELMAKDPKSYDGLQLRAYLAVADSRFKDAERLFQMANDLKPMQPELILNWTAVLFSDNQSKSGEKLALQLIETYESFGPIYDLLFRQYVIEKRLVDAENLLKTRVRNNPKEVTSAVQLAGFYARASRELEMQAALKRMLDHPADFPHAHLDVGDFYAQMQRWSEAIEEYEKGAKAQPTEKITFQKRIANVWLAQGKGERAMQVVADILKQQPSDEAAQGVQASILLAGGKPAEVAIAASQFQTLVNKSPDNPIWRFNLGRALAARGNPDGAGREFQEAIRIRSDFLPPLLALAEQSRAKGDYHSALQYQSQILAIQPNLPTIRLQHAVSLVNTGPDADARRELASLQKMFPNEVELQFALLDLKQKKFDQAESRFQKLLRQNGGDPRVVTGLVEIYAARDQLDKAVTLLQDELKKSPNSDAARSLLAKILVRLRKFDRAIEEYQRLLATKPQSAEFQMEIGGAYQLSGNLPSAIASFEKATALAPKDPIPLCLLGEALSVSGKKSEALQSFRRAVSLNPESADALNDLAFQIVDSEANLDEALGLAQKAFSIAHERSAFADTLGWIYLKKNSIDSAILIFRRLVEEHPDNPEFHYHFGMALQQKGNPAEARVQLQAALSNSPSHDTQRKIETALTGLPAR
jgi:tetratricopeptide (TPR) repeat protein